MGKRATVGTRLASLVKMAVPLCQQAERECPRTGPGRKPDIPDWVLAVLIMVAVLKRKKSKSSQYRFLDEHRRDLKKWLGTCKFPGRSTYFDRYQRAHRLFAHATRATERKNAFRKDCVASTATAIGATPSTTVGCKATALKWSFPQRTSAPSFRCWRRPIRPA